VTSVAIVYHSVGGRTRMLAEAVARGAAADGETIASLYAVPDVDHAALAAADAIVFGCPTYMGSASAAFKAFMDGTSAIWGLQGWRDKLAAAFTHSAAPSGDKLGTLTQLAVFAAQHGMIWVGLGLPPTYAGLASETAETNRLGSHLGAMAQSPPGARGVPESDLATAEHLGRRVAEAARRWGSAASAAVGAPPPARTRHSTATTWQFPPPERTLLSAPFHRTNLRELAARPERFEHQLVVCATLGRTQLEIVTASEPLYFGHINLSDEYALALPSGDPIVDRIPLRTFLTDISTGADVGRYNHRSGDLVLHPVGYLHWPGRLRPPYEPFDIPPGVRRCGLSLVFCASERTPGNPPALIPPPGREADVKAYVAPAPPMLLAAIDGPPGTIARIGTTELLLVERRGRISPPRGGWVVVLGADAESPYAACDLIRVPPGASLDARSILRALVLADPEAAPDPPPPSWRTLPPPPFAPFEDVAPGPLPFRYGALTVDPARSGAVVVSIDGVTAAVPRYWLARMLFRVALHGLRLGYVETYGGLFIDDQPLRTGHAIELGLRTPSRRASMAVPSEDVLGVIEQLYRSVAPPGYRERLR
jgi:NAD(P)H dehydrogenase (quinone)